MIETLGPTAELLGTGLVVDDAFRETDAQWLARDEFVATVSRLFAARERCLAPAQ